MSNPPVEPSPFAKMLVTQLQAMPDVSLLSLIRLITHIMDERRQEEQGSEVDQ